MTACPWETEATFWNTLKYTTPSETNLEAGNLYVFFHFSIEQPCKYAGICRPLTVGVELPWECCRVNSPSDTLQSLQIDLDHPGAQAFLQCSQQRLKETRPELMVQLPAASPAGWGRNDAALGGPACLRLTTFQFWGTNAGKTLRPTENCLVNSSANSELIQTQSLWPISNHSSTDPTCLCSGTSPQCWPGPC